MKEKKEKIGKIYSEINKIIHMTTSFTGSSLDFCTRNHQISRLKKKLHMDIIYVSHGTHAQFNTESQTQPRATHPEI